MEVFRAYVFGATVAILIILKHNLPTWSNISFAIFLSRVKNAYPKEKQAQGKQGKGDDLMEFHGYRWQCASRNGTAETCSCDVDHAKSDRGIGPIALNPGT